ncbi:cholinesterase 1-like [Lytechinus variegatus]|uniref:cholinesterase 1-like n=1 Tax=Lytechinus variegatus TaxID=7654 RepID=UPI001BB135F6|nr:cholinesterase 1-like [Lytechinus variegatus]
MNSFHVDLCIAVLCLWGSCALAVEVIGNPDIELRDATLTGITVRFDDPLYMKVNKSIDAYLGVPFAEPPVGERRFTDPEPLVLQGEYNATEDKAECPQMSPLDDWTPEPRPPFPLPIPTLPGPIPTRTISEDCLYLSIYTPSPKPSSLVPVLVWIHGGGYAVGGGSEIIYDPIPIVAYADIIVVNVNYRLGVFGFFTTGDDEATGNYGMMDQVLALQWVHDNIKDFGGDPNQVTIAGESAGGGSVSLHMLSPLTDGLFHQTIMQSGNAVCPWAWATMERATEGHRQLAEAAGCPIDDTKLMVSCMRDVDENELTRLAIMEGNGAISSPVVDGHFFPEDPVEMVKRRQFKVLPSLLGSNEDEAAINFAFLDLPSSLFEPPIVNLSLFMSTLPRLTYNAKTDLEISAVEQHYVNWKIADDASASQLDGLIRLSTDQTFACPTEYFARALEAAGAEVYRYEMTHDPSWSVYAGVPKWTGASHAEDLQYVFAWGLNPPLNGVVGQTDAEKFMSIEFVRYWTNFVKSGNPNEPISSSKYPEWPRYTMPEQEYKKLSLNMTNGRAMRASSCSFWLNYMPGLHLQTAPIEDIYEDWMKHYELWKNTDMPSWTEEFDKYKEENTCPTASPSP